MLNINVMEITKLIITCLRLQTSYFTYNYLKTTITDFYIQ